MIKRFIILLCFLPFIFCGMNPYIAGIVQTSSENPTETLRPDSDIVTTNWTYDSAGFYQDVSDDSDTTDIYTSNQNIRCIFTCADTSAASGKTIVKVTIYARARDTAGSTPPDFYVNPGDVYQYTFSAITGSLATYSYEMTENPHTSSAWTSANIDSTFIGLETANATNTTELADLWLVVEYEN
jgi:hypothetical protein